MREDVTFEVIGAAMEVHRVLGPGFLEGASQRGMEVELRHRGLGFERQRRIVVSSKGEMLGDHVLDLVVDRKVVVELKAVKEMNDQHRAELISYLKAARLPVGLVINFSRAQLQYKRFLVTQPDRSV